jgi:hypothetical protein
LRLNGLKDASLTVRGLPVDWPTHSVKWLGWTTSAITIKDEARPEDSMTQQPEQKPSPGPKEEQAEIILIRDLAPRASIKGGAAKLRFGETTTGDSEETPRTGVD